MVFLAPGDPAELTRRARDGLQQRYGVAPSAVGRAPGRVNLIGDHTDYNGGLCLPLALPHATYAAVARRDDQIVRLSSSRGGRWEGTLEGAGLGRVTGWAAYAAGVLWAMRDAGVPVPGVDVHVESTVPLGAGLSSSAALEAAVAVAVAAVTGLPDTPQQRRRLVEWCRRAENEVVGAPTGGLDQSAVLLTRAGHGLLLDFADGSAEPVPLRLAEAGLALLVTDTGVSHRLAEADDGYGRRRQECDQAATALGVLSLRRATIAAVEDLPDETLRRRACHVVTENARVREAVASLHDQRWERLGALLTASHISLRADFEVSCLELDLVVETAVQAGALGARMTGGGFGGSAVALVPEARVEAVVRAVDAAAAAAGSPAPTHLLAEPGPPAAPVEADAWAG